MSTAVNTRPAVGLDRAAIRPPSLIRLTRVEMRKMVDTRSGFWLLLVIALLSLGFIVINLFGATRESRDFFTFFQGGLFPTGVLLPVLGIMMITTEWSQRTTLTTFSLVPKRLRVVLAKILAGVVYALLAVVSSFVFAVIGFGLALALDRAPAGAEWTLPVTGVLGAVLFEVLVMLSGLAFGLVFMNTPVAIVLSFVLPTALTVLGQAVSAISDWVVWLDINLSASSLPDNSMTGDDWAHLATASVLWIWAPLVLGGLRLIRREVK